MLAVRMIGGRIVQSCCVDACRRVACFSSVHGVIICGKRSLQYVNPNNWFSRLGCGANGGGVLSYKVTLSRQGISVQSLLGNCIKEGNMSMARAMKVWCCLLVYPYCVPH